MKYQGKIILSNKNNSHTLAFDRIEEFSAGRKLNVLEVGCSTGYFGSVLTDRGHRVWGVEPYAPAAEEARCHLAYVHTGTIEEFFESHPEVRFDAIVFGDVLEHLINPVAALMKSKSFLAENGIVVASVPNITHFAIRAMLIEGRWEYSERGILDRTHLKFYTRDSVIDLFSDAGYRVGSVDAVQISAESADMLCAMSLKKESMALARQIACDHRGNDFQYVVVAYPEPSANDCHAVNREMKMEAGLRILCLVYVMESSLVDIRIREPLNRWAKMNAGTVRVISLYEHTAADLEWADVVVFQREADEYLLHLKARLQAQGKKVVFEIDDNLLELPPFLAHHERTLSRSRPYMIELMRGADALSVSTPALGKRLAGFNNNLHVTPNYGKANPIRVRHFSCPPRQMTIILASSDSVLVDMLIEPLLKIQKQYNCRVIGVGPPGQYLTRHGVCVQLQDIMPHVDFCRFLSSVDNAIGVIPLDDSCFSSCKSAVKYFDYSMAGLPSVCSNVSPYADVIQSGFNGYLVENETEAWTTAISSLIEDNHLRSRIAESAHSWVADHYNLDLTARAWSGLFESLNVDFAGTRNSRVSVPEKQVPFRDTVSNMLKYAVRPSAYASALSILRHSGFKGVYERLSRR